MKLRWKILSGLFVSSIASMAAAPAIAQTVVGFEGTVVASCILSASAPGVLVMSTSGTEIGTEQTGGSAATLNVVATGGTPTVKFTAPAMTSEPTTYAGTPTVSLKYTSTGGANQAYTTAASQYRSSNPLGDTVTLNAKAVDSAGFTAGSYQLQTIATCEQ